MVVFEAKSFDTISSQKPRIVGHNLSPMTFKGNQMALDNNLTLLRLSTSDYKHHTKT